jgi:Rieske Fe-S protein
MAALTFAIVFGDELPDPEHGKAPGASLLPIGFAVGLVVLLVGLVVSWSVVAIGSLIAFLFAFVWIRDLARATGLNEAPAVAREARTRPPPASPPTPALEAAGAPQRVSRSVFLELSTLGLGGVVGGLVTVPILGFAVGPAFLKQGVKQHDLGPLSDYPQGQFMIATFTSDPAEGAVSRRTAFVRNNGMLGNLPSFTIISNQCVHLGCPVQPNGPIQYQEETHFKDVGLIPVTPSGFGCPCHDSQYDEEGNRTAGPAVRALNRYSFSIINQHLVLGAPFSVAYVVGTGAQAKIHKTGYAFPGEQVTGIESWFYPIQPPHG